MSSKRKPFDQLRKLDNRKQLKKRHRERRFEPLEDRLLLAADILEANDSLATATFLGSEPAVTLRDLTIHEAGEGQSNPDFYRITASETGMLIVNSLFDHGQGDLDLRIRDSRGFVVATSASQSDNERLVIPVVAQQTYFVEIFGVDGATNAYALEVENFAAPVPQAVVLASRSDTGMMDNDRITADDSPIFTVQADLSQLLAQGVPLLAAGSQNGAAIFFTVRDADSGIVQSGYAEPLGDDLFGYTATTLPDGEFIVSAAVHIFDPRREIDPNNENATIADAAVGSSVQSTPIVVRIDTGVPEVTSGQMLPSSDSGMSQLDRVTNIRQPAFIGASGPNDKIRILANGLIVGEGVAGSDGRWEITVEPLTDGIHVMTTQVEDLAGNFGENSQIRLIEIDTIAPNTPFLDLTDESDTGLSTGDNVTGDDTLEFTMTTTDSNSADHLNEFNFKYRLYVRPEGGEEFLIYNSVEDSTIPPENFQGGFTNLEFLTRSFPELPDGSHNFKLEVEDRAGNISEDFLLNVTIDTVLRTLNGVVTIDLLSSSDSGMDDRDDVTRINQPTFAGVAEVDAVVTIFANGQVVGVGRVGSDETDFVPGDGLGAWQVKVEPLDDGVYAVLAHVEDLAGNFLRSQEITVEVDTLEPNTPHLDLLNDTGHSGHDDFTGDSTLNFNLTTEDPTPPGGHVSEFNLKYRVYVRPEGGTETLVYNSVTDTEIPAANIIQGFTDLERLQATLGPFPDGIHNFKLEVEDRAGNISQDFLLNVAIDSVLEAPDQTISIDMLASSDTGMSATDNVTNKMQPAFNGVAEIGSTVTLLAAGKVIGTGVVGTDETDLSPGDGLGAWEITVEPLADGIHSIFAHVEDWAGNSLSSEALTIEVDGRAPNTPFLDLVSASDTGVGARDEVTSDNTLTFTMTTSDEAAVAHLMAENLKYRLYVRPEGGSETLVYDSVTDDAIPAEAVQDGLVNLTFLQKTLAALPDGEHNFKLEVEDRAGNISEDFLLNVTIDTSLVVATIDLASSSDSGMSDSDNVTNTRQLTLTGVGDVGDRVSLYANGALIGTGFVGSDETDFVSGDGRGAWQITAQPLDDGIYDILAHLEDEAGNFQRTEPIRVEIDTLEPNTAHLDLTTASDTGHSQHDNITNDATPAFTLTTQDPNQQSHLAQFNYKYRVYLRAEGSPETLLYNSVVDAEIPAERIEEGFTDLEFLERTFGPFPDGIHNLKLEVEDRAGNISHDVTLTFEVDSTLPEVGSVDLLEASDSGMSNSDNVTNLTQPAFAGTGTPGTQVRLFANDQFVGTAEVGSDQSDGEPGNGLGVWEITSEPLADGVYTFRTTIEDWAGNLGESESLQVEIDTLAPNTPFLDLQESDDSGRNNDDNVTNALSLTFSATSHDANEANHRILVPEGQNLKYRLFVRPESGAESLVYDSSTDDSLAGRLDGFTAANQIAATVADLPEGLHNFKLEVEDRAGNVSHDFLLEVLIDRTPFAGTVGIKASDDTGVWGIDSTFGDGITGASDATLVGTAEANNVVTVLIDDQVAGTTVATPFDGDEAFQLGTWVLDTIVSLATVDTTLEVVFEDLAGNRASTELDVSNESSLVIDVTGPRVENVTRDDAQFTSVFDPKPAGGPDPLINSIVVHFSDGPERPAGKPYSAVLAELALEEGNYRLVGDAFGNIPITQVSILSDNQGPGVAMTAVRLDFGVSLPDDRYTLTVFDRILDAAGNPLDGDSGANGPFEGNAALVSTPPIFPTGDGNHGGDFIARFTVDSRPELGVWAGGSVYVDTNGNFLFDPTNRDYVNRDITYGVGFTSDDVFAGNFTDSGTADGYDKLAAYGRFGGWVDGTFRWLIDLDNDGVVDIDVEDHADVNGLPVAGNFDGDALNGDEVALYTGRTWHFDTDHDYRVDTSLYSQLIGYPVVGDFDRDGFDDLATWADDTFMVDLANGAQNGWDGVPDAVFRFGFIGVRERPVSADMDQDGFDDLGLWVPDRGGMTMRESGEWYWLVSGGSSVLDRIVPSPDPVRTEVQEIQFTPIPFGNDILAQFGDEFAIPVVGNFDPPTLPIAVTKPSFTNPQDPLDVDDDGHVSPRDVLLLVNHLNAAGPSAVDELAEGMPYLDSNADGFITARDALAIINYLNQSVNADAVDDIATDVAFALAAASASGEDDEVRDDESSLSSLGI